RFEQRNAEALVIGHRGERLGAAVVGDELGHADGTGERHGLLKSAMRHVGAQALEIAAGVGRRADEIETRVAVGLAVLGEAGDEIVRRLLRYDLPDEKDRALAGEAPGHGGVRLDVEGRPVDEDRHDRGLNEAGSLELLAVVLAVADAQLADLRKRRQLLAAERGPALVALVP